MRLAGASLFVLILLAAPASRASTGARVQPQRPPGYLGIEFHDLTNDQAAALHLRDRRGVEVLLVDHDGPAASAGLQPHDLITGFNGHIVASGEALRRVIRETGAGVQVTLSVFRNGNPITIRAKLANQEDLARKTWQRLQDEPPPPGMMGKEMSGGNGPGPATPAAPVHAQGFIDKMVHGSSDGIVVEAMQPQLASYFGASGGQGLLVQSVEQGSAAAMAGLQAGDVILRADSEAMRSASEWSKHLRSCKGKPMTLELLRDHQQMTLTLAPDTKSAKR